MDLFPKINAPAKMVIDSLQNDGESWLSDAYHLYRETDDSMLGKRVSLWIANGACFVKLETPKGFPFNVRERVAVWRAFLKWRKTVRGQAELVRLLNTGASK